MRHIQKKGIPPNLDTWKTENPSLTYKDMPETERRAIRQHGLIEQGYLCAYCTCPVTVDSGVNAHLVAQSVRPHAALDWHNIVVSCDTNCQCDKKQGARTLRLTPLMPECEKELSFTLSGKISSSTERAQDAITMLALNVRSLSNKRRNAIDIILYGRAIKSMELMAQEECWDELLYQCEHPNADGAFMPYAPVLANILRQLIASRH